VPETVCSTCVWLYTYTVCEVSGIKRRSAFAVGWNAMIALGAAVMPAVAFFVRDYKRLQAIYTWPQFALFAYALYVPTDVSCGAFFLEFRPPKSLPFALDG